MSIDVYTYYNKSEPKTVYKILDEGTKKQYQGEFVDEINIMNPVIRIEGSAVSSDCNYVYIPSLDRYYFITSIVSVRSNITMLYCKIDVLYTYKTSLLKCYGLIDRAENDDSLNRYVYDDNFVRESPNAIIHEAFTGEVAQLDTRLVLLTVFGTQDIPPSP